MRALIEAAGPARLRSAPLGSARRGPARPGSMSGPSAVSDPQHPARLLRALSSFREESRFCDAHLVLEGEEIPVQKNILAAASPYIRYAGRPPAPGPQLPGRPRSGGALRLHKERARLLLRTEESGRPAERRPCRGARPAPGFA